MGRLLLTSKEKAKTPFTFEEIGIEVSTLEELCYIFYHYYEIIIDDFPSERLLDWVHLELNECGLLDGMENESTNNKKYLLFLYNSFLFSEEELEELGKNLICWEERSWQEKMKRRGDLALQFRKFSVAMRFYSELLSEDKPEIYHNMAVIEMNLGQYKKAIDDFKKAFQMSSNLESLTEYLLALLVDKQYDFLFLELIKYSKIYSDARLWYVFGLYYEHNNDIDSALDSYYKAICSEDVTIYEPYKRVVKLLLSRGQESKAYDAIIDLEGKNKTEFTLNLSYIYEALLETEKAIDLLEQLDVEEKDKKRIYYRLSQLYEKEGQMIKALDSIHKGKLIESDDSAIQIRIGRLDKKVGLTKSYYDTVDQLMERWKAIYRRQIS